ncbi:MAG TPA: carboxypeptidase regulatory-like domain-containing protein [Gemmatimonadaceae bacterium]
MRNVCTFCVLTLAFAGQVCAQSGGIAGIVVARSTGEALPYSIVEIEGTAFSVFANDSGRFAFRGVATGLHVLHVRRLGFTPADVSVQVQTGAADTLTVSLDHVAVQLGGVTVRAFPPCTAPGPPAASDSALTTIFEQVKLNARQYKYLAEHYPFDQVVEVHKTRKLRGSKDALLGEPLHNVTYHSTDKRQYAPGGILKRRGRDWYFEIPELIDVAEPSFINAHCWHYAGVDTIDDVEHYRVDIVAADTLPDADVNGSFYINSRSFQIRRSVLHFSRRPSQVKSVESMETTTEFFEVLPSIPVISKVRSVQVIDPSSLYSETYEDQRTIDIKFRNRKPGDGKP